MAVEYLDKVWKTKEKEREWKRVDMDWFGAVVLKTTKHRKPKSADNNRDPAKPANAFKKKGHHPKFGPPFMCLLGEDKSLIADHNVAIITTTPTTKKVYQTAVLSDALICF